MTKKAKGQEEIRERVALMLRAQLQIRKIVELKGASRRKVYNIKQKIEDGLSLKHVKEAICRECTVAKIADFFPLAFLLQMFFHHFQGYFWGLQSDYSG